MRLLLTLIVLNTLCSILKVCVLVQGRYVVEVRVNGYSNPTGRCGDERHCRKHTSDMIRCCDSSDNTNCGSQHLCDSYFTYCLRPFGDDRQPPDGCYRMNEFRDVSSVNTDDGPLNFSQSRLLGLNNPQVFSGLEVVYKGVQVYIDIKDYDGSSNPDDLVDVLLIDHNLTVAATVRQNHTGIYNLITMDLTITVLCEGNSGGSDCTQCVPGFTGTNCSERDYCFGVNCSGRGYCENNLGSFTCMCNNGYKGRLCESVDCSANDCNGNGVCMDDNNSPSCICNPDFTGRECEIKIDDCLPNPCGVRGQLQCMDGVNIFQCICDPGFIGDTCQTNIDDCVGVDCSGNGQCVDGVNNYTCDCSPGFSGPLCSSEVDSSNGSNSSAGDSGNVGAIAGGVIGALLAVVILLILIVVTFVIVSKCQNKRFKLREVNNQGNGNSGNPMPGDNPVYEPGYTVNGGLLPHSIAAVTFPTEREGSDSSVEERKFDNPIYGDGETDDSVYTVPYDQQDEFDNPIYGTETYDN